MKPFCGASQTNIQPPNSQLVTFIKHGINIEQAQLIRVAINASVNESHNHTLLHYASMMSNLKNVELLVKNGAEINCQNKFQETPLHIAARHGQLDIVTYLVEKKGADLSLKDQDNKMAKDIAQTVGHANIATYLMSQEQNSTSSASSIRSPAC